MSALKKVLVVDDDPVVAKSFERSLSKQEYVVVTASNGEEALTKLRDGKYDVVFTDIKMPGMDGIELTEQIRAKKAWTPVVIITGYGTEEAQQKAEELSVVEFIQKPLTPESIEEAAHRAVTETPPPALEAPAWGIQSEETVVVTPKQMLKNAGLLMTAPFIGLFYALMMPFVGLGLLGMIGFKALTKNEKVKAIGIMVGAPFIALAYIVAMPFVGLGALTWYGMKAAHKELIK